MATKSTNTTGLAGGRFQRADRRDTRVICGYAAATYCSSHVTSAREVCAVLTPQTVEVLRKALAEWNPRHRMTSQRLSFLLYPSGDVLLKNLYLQTDVGVIDILTLVLGVGNFARLKQNAEELEIDGRRCWVISLEDLITAKEAVGREHELLTAKGLRAIAARQAARANRPSQ